MIELKKLNKQFGTSVIFDEVDLKIEKAGIHMILGESGSGKSTLLNLLAGYEPPTSGQVIKEGVMATIFQNYELIPELTVKDNIYIAPEIKHLTIKNESVILSLLGLNELMQYYPSELSGGQRQRVGIARALFQEPSIILCDEPTESLDRENKQIVMQLLVELSKECIVIIASHDRKIIDEYADMLYRIENKKIVCEVIHTLTSNVKVADHHEVDKARVNHYLKKILSKKTFLFSIIIALLCTVALSLFGVEKNLFQPFNTFESITKDRIYIRSKDSFNYEEYGLNVNPLVDFDSIKYENQNYRFLMVPYITNDFEMQGIPPKGLEAVINQNAAKQLGEDAIGKTVKFKFRIQARFYEVEMVISGIVQENDIEREAIYYSKAGLNKYLSEQYRDDGLSIFEAIQMGSTYNETIVDYKEMNQVYAKLKLEPKLMIENPLYDERETEQRQKQVFQTTFQAAEILLVLGGLITVIIYSVLDTKKYMRNCSIFITLGASVKLVKQVYLKTKIGIFTIVYGLFILLQQVIFYLVSDYRLSQDENIVAFGMIGLVYLIFVLFISISMSRLKEDRINALLKDGADL